MRIVHVITRLIIGGAQENTLLSCEGQQDRGHEVTLITGPAILGHNLETVPRLYHKVRPQAKYQRSLKVLQISKEKGFISKTGIMVGLGEEADEIESIIDDLVAIGCDILTIGQYLQPTAHHLPVVRYVPPEEFVHWKRLGESRGLRHVESGPLVRSSYHAEKQVHAHAAAMG